MVRSRSLNPRKRRLQDETLPPDRLIPRGLHAKIAKVPFGRYSRPEKAGAGTGLRRIASACRNLALLAERLAIGQILSAAIHVCNDSQHRDIRHDDFAGAAQLDHPFIFEPADLPAHRFEG